MTLSTGCISHLDFAVLGVYPEPFLLWRSRNGIQASDLTTFDSTLLVGGLASSIYSLDFDSVDNKVFFINFTHISRAHFDCSGTKIVAENVKPRNIVVDWIGRRILWTSVGQSHVKTMRLDGGERRIFIRNVSYMPDLIALDPIAG